MNLLIVGSVAYDTIKTPHGDAKMALGGSATYASVASSYFCHPGIVGVVGSDFRTRDINLLKKRAVDLEGLQIDPRQKTFHWSGFYEGDMNQANTISTDLNAFASFSPTIPQKYEKAKAVLLGNIHPALQLEVLSQTKKAKLTLCDTMNFWISSEPKLVEKVFRKVDVICINDGEACQFTGTSSVPKAAGQLLKLGAKRVIIKRGANGVSIFGKGSFFSLPALPLTKVIDPTGAGDSFAGGFMGFMTSAGSQSEASFQKALAVGTVMASYCVQGFSCKKTVSLTKADIKKRLVELKKATTLPEIKL